MEKLLFRCSQLGSLISDPRLKADKEAGNLSEGAKTYIESIWLNKKYGYKELVQTDEIMKGVITEPISIELSDIVLGNQNRTKNDEHFSNEFIDGEPDVLLEDAVEDVKGSWTIKTFFESELTTKYEWQLRGYMWLTGIKKARLIYCLNDTPEGIIDALKYRNQYKYSGEALIRANKQIDKNHLYSHLPPSERVKVFEVEHSDEKIEFLKTKIEKAREYYSQLKLV